MSALLDLLKNESLRQSEFPVARSNIFLAHAGVCPLPARVVSAMNDYLTRCTQGDQEEVVPLSLYGKSRKLAASLLAAHENEIAFVGPTSLALSYVASGLTFAKRDNVIIYPDDYPSNVYPWRALQEKGVEVREVAVREYGQITLEDVLEQVDQHTRLVALSSAHFVSGFRIDHLEIGRELRSRGILFCLDAIQTLGAFPLSVEAVDFVAADSHKWLLGPCASGILFVRKALQEQFRPPIHGWHNVRCPNYVAQEEIVFPPDGRRYEAGTPNLAGLVGMCAAMSLLQEVGIETIAAELLRQRASLVEALVNKGYGVLNPTPDPQNSSGITTFYKEKSDLTPLHQKLTAAKIITSLRADRRGQKFIRLSPHFYNTDAEIERLMELL